jgi:hypothetical protein
MRHDEITDTASNIALVIHSAFIDASDLFGIFPTRLDRIHIFNENTASGEIMQRNEFTNKLVLWHYDRTREATNNMMFSFASFAPSQDRNNIVSDNLRAAMGWPAHIKSLFEYRMMFSGVYERLFQFCVISLCSDAEAFFKDAFDKYGFPYEKKGVFFQRLNSVIAALESAGVELTSVQSELAILELAFQIRHIGIHNMGLVDKKFHDATGKGTIGETYPIGENEYKQLFNAYIRILEHLDSKFPSLAA